MPFKKHSDALWNRRKFKIAPKCSNPSCDCHVVPMGLEVPGFRFCCDGCSTAFLASTRERQQELYHSPTCKRYANDVIWDFVAA